MKRRVNEIIMIIAYALLIGLAMWFNQSTKSNGLESDILYTIIMFVIVLLMYLYTFNGFRKINKIMKSLENVRSMIDRDYQLKRGMLWNDYKNNISLFSEKILDGQYQKYVSECKQMDKDDNGFGGDIEDYISYDLVDNVVHKEVISIFPGMMTGLGILFTFFGLSICLKSFDTTSAEQIMSGIDPLMGGLKVAFHTSIYGLIFSLIFNFCYRRKIEDAYKEVDEFVDLYKGCVRSNTITSGMSQLISYQEHQKDILETISNSLVNNLSEAFGNAVKPQLDELSKTVVDFTEVSSKTQTEGIKNMVTMFLDEMNKSVGNEFSNVRDSMKETCEVQGKYAEDMRNSLTEITNTMETAHAMTSKMEESVNEMETYVSSMQKLQEEMQKSFAGYTEQIANNNEMISKQQEYLAQMADAQKSIFTVLSTLQTELQDNLVKMQDGTGKFVETSEQATITLMQKMEDWSVELQKTITESEMRLQQLEAELAENNKNSIALITQNVEGFGKTLSSQAVEQAEGIQVLKNQISDSMDKSASRLENTISNISVKISTAIENGVSEYNKELIQTVQSLNSTVRSIRESGDVLPQVINGSQKELETAIQTTEDKMNKLIDAVDDLYRTIANRQAAIEQDGKALQQIKRDIDQSMVELQKEKEEILSRLENKVNQEKSDIVEKEEENSMVEEVESEIESGEVNGVIESEEENKEENEENSDDFSLAGLDFSKKN